MKVGDKLTVDKKVFAYGTGSVALVVPAQLRIRPGQMVRVTFEMVEDGEK